MTIIADVCKSNSEICNNNTIDKDDLEVFARLKAQKGTESDAQKRQFTELIENRCAICYICS